MPLRLVMMGTGTFALPTFLSLYHSPHQVVGLFTQPDRAGRGHHHHPHPMKEAAVERGTPVFQPDKVNTPESLAELRSLQADLFVVAAYGQILSAELLSIPRLGAINLHASLLPKYRGAAPIQYAVWKGESETGITIFQIEPKLDAGPILGIVRTPIGARETSGELEDRLAELAVPLTLDVIEQLERGTAEAIPQPAGQATKAPRLKKQEGDIDWSLPSAAIDCHVRAMQPWPMAFTQLHRQGHDPLRLQVLAVTRADVAAGASMDVEPGTVVVADARQVMVRTGDGCLQVDTVRPDGKRAMSIVEFLQGRGVRPGDRFLRS